jgi:hypothetical protein
VLLRDRGHFGDRRAERRAVGRGTSSRCGRRASAWCRSCRATAGPGCAAAWSFRCPICP